MKESINKLLKEIEDRTKEIEASLQSLKTAQQNLIEIIESELDNSNS